MKMIKQAFTSGRAVSSGLIGAKSSNKLAFL
jgi:hypothetical protein